MLVPARNEERVLPATLPTVLAAAAKLGAEVLVISPESSPVHADPPVRAPALRWIATRRPGKFEALRVGADAADGDILVLFDADVMVSRDAVSRLVQPISDGGTDVTAGRIDVLTRAFTPTHRLLERWSSVSVHAWDMLRSRHPEFLWALPGAVYAIRRELFPSRLLVPLVDDASIGLQAREEGAAFTYAGDALVRTPAPLTYPDWASQKLRSRRGWAELAMHRPREVAMLERSVRGYFAMAGAGESTRWLMCTQDRFHRFAARTSLVFGCHATDGWTPRRADGGRAKPTHWAASGSDVG